MSSTALRLLLALLSDAAHAIGRCLKNHVEELLRRLADPLWENHPEFV